MSTLVQNVERNKLTSRVTVRPLDWNDDSGLQGETFDTIVAADTLWNSELHIPFCKTILRCLRKQPQAKAHVVAGLHTGRYALQNFIETAQRLSLDVLNVIEYRFTDGQERTWGVEREGETREDMTRWLLYITVKHRINE